MIDSPKEPKDNGLGLFHYTLEKWITDEKVGFEFINVLGHLYYDRSIELIIFRSQLIDRTSSVILYKHAYSQNTVGTPLKIQDSLHFGSVGGRCMEGQSAWKAPPAASSVQP